MRAKSSELSRRSSFAPCINSPSQIYYHLEEYGEAVRLALAAGSYFDVMARSEYVETIVCE